MIVPLAPGSAPSWCAVEPDGVAGFQNGGVALGKSQAQAERLLADRGDGIAIQHHRAFGQRHGQHAPGDRRQNLTFVEILLR